jgi:hypothetical protein
MLTSTRSPIVQNLLDRHREEAQRLREERGDPVEFIALAVRDSFDAESLAAAFRDLTEGVSIFDEDDVAEG